MKKDQRGFKNLANALKGRTSSLNSIIKNIDHAEEEQIDEAVKTIKEKHAIEREIKIREHYEENQVFGLQFLNYIESEFERLSALPFKDSDFPLLELSSEFGEVFGYVMIFPEKYCLDYIDKHNLLKNKFIELWGKRGAIWEKKFKNHHTPYKSWFILWEESQNSIVN